MLGQKNVVVKQSLGSNVFLGQNFRWPNVGWSKMFGSTLGVQKLLSIPFWGLNIFGGRNFGGSTIIGVKIFVGQIFLGFKNFGRLNNWGRKKFGTPKHFRSQIFGGANWNEVHALLES